MSFIWADYSAFHSRFFAPRDSSQKELHSSRAAIIASFKTQISIKKYQSVNQLLIFNKMKKYIRPALVLTLGMVAIVGVYTLFVFGIAKITPEKGLGEQISVNGKRQYANIGQQFTLPQYFHGRPSAVYYNAAGKRRKQQRTKQSGIFSGRSKKNRHAFNSKSNHDESKNSG